MDSQRKKIQIIFQTDMYQQVQENFSKTQKLDVQGTYLSLFQS